MLTDKTELMTMREKRIVTAIELGTPDRVPWIPKVAGFIQYDADSNYYMAMQDSRNQEEGYRQFVRRYDPDAVTCYKMYNIPVMDALNPVHLRYPGPEHGIPIDSSFQHLDGVFLQDDEYKEFIENHSQFIISKLWPRKFAKLAGLSKIGAHQVYDYGVFAEMAAFADPEVQDAFRVLGEAGRAQIRRNQQDAQIEGWLNDEGYFSFAQGSMVTAFDAFADGCRGITQITMDTILHADELMQALHVVHDYTVAGAFARFKAAGAKRIFIPLHCGVDEFMSAKTYEKFYWPFLKKIILGLIDVGITPWVFCEGKYNTRLDCIADVPKGKVVYSFEEVDMKRVKETVGKVACITGNLPTALLVAGTPEQVTEETKRLLDICAPGGGFIMDCSIIVDNGKRENMLAWREATEKYGKY
jgi:hypothetical protein